MGSVSATSAAEALENYRKDYDATLKDARLKVQKYDAMERQIKELQKENQRLTNVNEEAQKNFDELVSVQSDLKVTHENDLIQVTEVHATYKRDLTGRLRFVDEGCLVSHFSRKRRLYSD